MSSMVRKMLSPKVALAALAVASLGALAAPAAAQSGRMGTGSNLVAQQPGEIGAAITKWEQLTGNRTFAFADYAGFALAYPAFPRAEMIRIRAENRLDELRGAANHP